MMLREGVYFLALSFVWYTECMATQAIRIDIDDPCCMTHSQMESEEAFAALTEETIQARAYELWQQRGCPEGSPEVDWFAAQNELIAGSINQ
jgi:Protein of unknown function (DUF2934)